MFSRIDLSVLSVNFSYVHVHVCIIYAAILKKMSSDGLEVSFSIYTAQGCWLLRLEVAFHMYCSI